MERRSFFKLAGAAVATVGAGSVLTACNTQSLPFLRSKVGDAQGMIGGIPVDFSEEADVLVVGSGLAGLSAAMYPSEAKLSVRIAEKAELLGGESFDASGLFHAVGTQLQQQAGIAANVDDAWKAQLDKIRTLGSAVDQGLAKSIFYAQAEWVDRAIAGYGAQFADPQDYVGKGSPDSFLLPKNGVGDMTSIMSPLKDTLTSQGVAFDSGMRALDFIVDRNLAPIGMRLYADKSGHTLDVKAKRIVIATGGFACNQAMVQKYLPDQQPVGCFTTYSSGEGHLLCNTVSGQMADMDKAASYISDLPQVATWGLFGPTIVVDAMGRRFACEDKVDAAANACIANESGYWWTVFDKQLREGSQVRNVAENLNKHAKRTVGPFDKVEDLANAIAVPADTLKATFDRYNSMVDGQADTDFGRTLFLQKLDGPYYAMKQFAKRYLTLGGMKVDDQARLLQGDGQPVENVYCCGSCAAGSLNGLASAAAFGMLAGKAAAASLA